MSFLKKVLGRNTPEEKPQEPQNNANNAMQSMYEFEEKKDTVVPTKSYQMESIKPGKPPAPAKPAKGGLFSNMKVKKQTEEKRQETTMATNHTQGYVAPSFEESKVQSYQPPEIPKTVITQQPIVQQQQPISNFFKKNSSQRESSDHQNIPTIKHTSSFPFKRKNSSNSAIEPQQPTKQVSSKKSLNNIAPARSTTNSTNRATSKSSLDNKNGQQIPVRRKSQVKLDEVKQIQNQMLQAKERIIQKMKVQKDVKNKIMNESQSLILLKERQNQSIQKQNAAVESQDYDKAAELQQQLTSLKQQISIAELQLVQLQKQFIRAQQNICSEYAREQQQKVIFKKRLIRAKSDAENIYEFVMKTETQKIQLQKGKMERDRKKLSSIQAELSFNQQKIKQLQNQYQQDLNNQTRLFQEQKDDLSNRKVQITDDIRDLEIRLQQKKDELLQVEGELEQADYNIQEVKRGFENEYRKIVQRKDKLYQMEIERDQFRLGLNQLQLLTDEQGKSLDSTLNQMRQSIVFITEQSEGYASSNASFNERLAKRQSAFSEFMTQTTALKQFQNTIRIKQDKLKELQFKKSSLAMEISLFDSKRKELKEKVPQLQSQKITLVSSKNFKGAQLKSTQIKQANEQLVTLSSQIQDKFNQQKQLDKIYADAQQALDAQKEIEDRLKKNLARSQFKLQSIRYNDLNLEKNTLSRYTSTQKNELVQFVQNEIMQLKQELDFLASEYELQREQQSPQKQNHQTHQNHQNHQSYQKPEEQEVSHYQNLNEEKQQQNDNEGYISASPLDIYNQQTRKQSQQPSQKESEQKVVEEQRNQSSDNNNQRSQQESIEQVKNDSEHTNL